MVMRLIYRHGSSVGGESEGRLRGGTAGERAVQRRKGMGWGVQMYGEEREGEGVGECLRRK